MASKSRWPMRFLRHNPGLKILALVLAAKMEEAENLEKSGQMSSHGTKKLRYETRKLTQRLSP